MGAGVPFLITQWHGSPSGVDVLDVAGAVVAALGAALVVACFVLFVLDGRGTPAPIAPTEELVVRGPYRVVRNPMYVGVAAAVAGQALAFRSVGLVVWLVVFLLAVVSFVKGYEEPTLSEQFGAPYDRYRRRVPGWLPRVRRRPAR
ncbi:isoprenylcysteine carboxyl methyltransferase [Nocardioides currus]|uniref:Isoprenylcysteine carboxyl methyltransferase n=2 Tax=Nocardioides currus TaxID=2133958 RepID=A0A2R7Z3E2_9ACTN|nr:isoprenylcysteine carboxyl methyltransferase [Nocardioides currus]